MTKNLLENDLLVDSVEAANYIGVKPKTLPIWRCLALQGKKAPNISYVKIGRLVRYKLSTLDRYIDSREVKSDDK